MHILQLKAKLLYLKVLKNFLEHLFMQQIYVLEQPFLLPDPHYQNGKNVMAAGRYLIAEVKKIDGNVDDILLQGLETQKCHLEYENGQIFLVIKETRDATQVYWDGTHTLNEWNLNENENFNNAGEADIFVSGDDVIFDDAATDASVRINENLYPKTVTFDNDTKTYSLSGNGGISGETGLTKKGNGTLVITSTNTYTGKTTLEGGVTAVSALADSIVRKGALGCYTKEIGNFEIKNGATLRNTVAIKNGVPITIGEGGAVFQTDGELTLNKPLYGNGNTLTKTGASNLILFAADNLKKTYLKEGTLQAKGEGVLFGDTLIFIGNATYQDFDDGNTYSLNLNNLKVEEGVTRHDAMRQPLREPHQTFRKRYAENIRAVDSFGFHRRLVSFRRYGRTFQSRQLVRLEQQLRHAQGDAKHPGTYHCKQYGQTLHPRQSDRKRNLNRRQQHLAYRFVERRFLFPRQDRRHRHATD